MDQIRIAVRVPLSAAVAAGRTHYGETSVALSDADVATLSPAARARLASMRGCVGLRNLYDRIEEIEVDRADAPATLEAIERTVAAIEAKLAAERAESEQQIARALASPDEEWVSLDGLVHAYYEEEDGSLSASPTGNRFGCPRIWDGGPRGAGLSRSQLSDPRVIARVAAINITTRIAEHERRYAEWITLVERANAEKKARADAWASVCRAYVIEHVPEYARAAKEGADVRTLAKRSYLATLSTKLAADTEAYSVDSHPRPHQRAYDALDAVRRALDGAPTYGGLVTRVDTRIVRVNTCPEDDCTAGKRTCVEIAVQYGDDTSNTCFVYADGGDPHVHEADETDE